MKQETSLLDSFVKKALQTADAENPPVDWSEVDVLLQHEQKSVSLPNPRYIFIGAGILVLAVGIFFLVKFIGSSGNSPGEQVISADTGAVLISVPDSAVNISPAPSSVIDSAKADTTHREEKIIIADTAKTEPEKLIEKKKTDTAKSVKKEPVKTEKKKNKLSSLAPDTTKKEEAPESILPDTQENKPEEIKNNSTEIPADTAKYTSPKKSGKPKKGKTKSTDTVAPAAPAKPDSLK